MNLEILLPYGVFAAYTTVARIVVQTQEGSYGLLPHRRDCVAALVPGILLYELEGAPEGYVALDEGVLVKTGPEVLISVRNAVAGTDLAQLRAAVNADLRRSGADERRLRAELARIETRFIGRLAALHRG